MQITSLQATDKESVSKHSIDQRSQKSNHLESEVEHNDDVVAAIMN